MAEDNYTNGEDVAKDAIKESADIATEIVRNYFARSGIYGWLLLHMYFALAWELHELNSMLPHLSREEVSKVLEQRRKVVEALRAVSKAFNQITRLQLPLPPTYSEQ